MGQAFQTKRPRSPPREAGSVTAELQGAAARSCQRILTIAEYNVAHTSMAVRA